jgi:hypothetical protein
LGQYYRHEKIQSYPIIGNKLAALMKQEAPSYIDDAAIDDLDVRGIDYSQIGQNAYEEHVRGYQAWQQRLDEYAAFLV